jgi:D-xylose 1-dehydrogenase (NADP+, D-xylono-1,5-lactone-forming)
MEVWAMDRVRAVGERVTNQARWGLLSTARINSRILAGARESQRVVIAAVASRDEARATGYAAEHGIDRAYGSYEALLADPAIDAVYISLPNHLHVEWSIRSLEAGKHVLCEKPLAWDARDLQRAFHAASRADRWLSEAFMWRHNPQTRLVERLVSDGAIGRVREVHCVNSFDLRGGLPIRKGDSATAQSTSREWSWLEDIRMSEECKGGALMDVGCYCVNAIRLFAGEPRTVTATQEIGPTGVDVRISGVLQCGEGVVGRFEAGVVDARGEELRILGKEGRIVVHAPFLCERPGIELHRRNGVEEVAVAKANSYQLELENMSEAIVTGSAPLLGVRDGMSQAAAIEALRTSAVEGRAVDVRPMHEEVERRDG